MSDRITPQIDASPAVPSPHTEPALVPAPAQPPSQKEVATAAEVAATNSDTTEPTQDDLERTPLKDLIYQELAEYHLGLHLLNLVLQFCPHLALCRLRTRLYRLYGVQIGSRSLILGNLRLTGPGPICKRLRIGNDCVLNAPICFNLNAEITLGNNVYIGNDVLFITSDHLIGPSYERCDDINPKPIVVEDGCWIGAGAMIAPGVTIGRGSIVSMGAVVSADVPPNKLVGGNPARAIKSLPE